MMNTFNDDILNDDETWNEIDPSHIKQYMTSTDAYASWSDLLVKHRKRDKRTWCCYTVAVAFFALFTWTLYQLLIDHPIELTAGHDWITHVMPDNSKVFLEPGSKLSYRHDFNVGHRQVYLEGGAHFEICKHEEHAFVIDTKGTAIQLPASSMLHTPTGTLKIQVGRDKVIFFNNLPAYKTFGKENYQQPTPRSGYTEESNNSNPLNWGIKQLSFKGEEAQDVLELLSQYYHVELDIQHPDDIVINAFFNENSQDREITVLKRLSVLEIKMVGPKQ